MPLQKVFLSFDDGPNEPYTSQILDTLKAESVRASFFVCGKNVRRFPEVTKRIVADGHAIGNHSHSHSFFLTLLGLLKKETLETNQIIESVTGVRPTLFRPPWGLATPWLKSQIPEMQIVRWDIDSRDWRRPGVEKIVKRVTKNIRPGAIVLLHDGQKTKGGDRSQTVTALPLLIRALKDKGYTFAVLPNGQ